MKLPISLSFEHASTEPDRCPRYILRDADGHELGHIWQSTQAVREHAHQIVAAVNSKEGQIAADAFAAATSALRLLHVGSVCPVGVNVTGAKEVLRKFLDDLIKVYTPHDHTTPT